MSHALQHLWITPSARESVVCQLKSWKHQQGRDNGAFKPSLPHVLNLKVRAAAAGGLSREDDSACAVKDFSHLADLLLGLQTVVKDGYIKVGPEMRDRVDRLSDRVVLLRNSAERTPGGRIPVQLIATLKALEREFLSLENIVKKSLEGGPFLDDLHGGEAVGDYPQLPGSQLDKEPKSAAFHSLVRERDIRDVDELKIERVPPEPSYVMTAPDAFGASPLAKFRAEIERRVKEQLVENKKDNPRPTTGTHRTQSSALSSLAGRPSRSSAVLEYTRMRPSTEATTRAGVTAQRPLDAAAVGVEEVGLTKNVGEEEFKAQNIEVEKLKQDIFRYKVEYKQAKLRADLAEAQVLQLTEQIATNVTSDVHEELVRRFRNSLAEARVKVAQITTESREKEVMLAALKQQLDSEHERLVSKVAELTAELASRVTLEEMEAAVNSAVQEAQLRASIFCRQLEEKERTINELTEKWVVANEALKLELAVMKAKLEVIELERARETADLHEAKERVRELEEELAKMRSLDKDSAAEVEEDLGEFFSTYGQGLNGTPKNGNLSGEDGFDANSRSGAATKEKGTALSEQKVELLEKFFTMMGGVMNQQEIEVDFWILGVQVPSAGTPFRKKTSVQD